jgi:hypothetical protein
MKIDRGVAREAKALVCLAFRNGPIEAVHSGEICPTCHGSPEYGRITDHEMKQIMKNAVNWMATLLMLRQYAPEEYERRIAAGLEYTSNWDAPTSVIGFRGTDLLEGIEGEP